MPLTFHPVDAERWSDLESLFAHHGNPGYCWCQRWRVPSGDYLSLRSDGRRMRMEAAVRAAEPVGILGYLDGEPVAWCSVAPRETYAALERSRVLKRIDNAPVWSIVCLYLARHVRRQGVTLALLRAAVEHAHAQGAHTVEGYPVEVAARASASYAWMGSPALFRRAGFVVVAEPQPGRFIMRHPGEAPSA